MFGRAAEEAEQSQARASQGVSVRLRVLRGASNGAAQEARSPLNAHVADGGGRRSDEDDAFLFARLCELRVLRQKAITGVHSLKKEKKKTTTENSACEIV